MTNDAVRSCGNDACRLGLTNLEFRTAVVSAQATSHIRIVRLSYVDGTVQISRANGEGLDRAILNSPVVEGSRLVTGSNGLAEVEFENNSALRLGENTEVQFSQLLLNDSGDKVNEVKLVHGTIYFDTHRGKGDIDRVLAAGRTFILRHDSQVRFIATSDEVQAAVMNGELRLDNSNDFLTAKKKDTITVDASRFLWIAGIASAPPISPPTPTTPTAGRA